MKITRITVKNFLGARNIDAHLSAPISLFCGLNASGKSSVQEAVRMALIGENARVALKKDYGHLITDGESSAEIRVQTERAGLYGISLPSGKCRGLYSGRAIPYVLDAQRFSQLPESERRTFLFGLMRLSTDSDRVAEMLKEAGCEPGKIEVIHPFLTAGFEAAHKEAAGKAREAKGAWRAISGETYGSNKAEGWTAPSPHVDDARINELESQIMSVQAKGEAAIASMAELKTRASIAQNNAQRIADLTEKAGQIKRIKDKLAIDETGLAEWAQKIEASRNAAQGDERTGLVHDLARALDGSFSVFVLPSDVDDAQRETLGMMDAALAAYVAQYGELPKEASTPDPEAKQNLPVYEKSLKIYQTSVANGKRDLLAAEAAAAALDGMAADQGQPVPTDDDITVASAQLAELREIKKTAEIELATLQNNERIADDATSRTAKAASHHIEVRQWGFIADQLSPDGIPSHLLSSALEPINARLLDSAGVGTWPNVRIDSDMHITYGGRDYTLLSESEKWRADAMIAEAISFLSGEKLLVLDRFDVLDIKGRSDLIFWLDAMALNGEIETALLFGTLKSAPSDLPENVNAYWIASGGFTN